MEEFSIYKGNVTDCNGYPIYWSLLTSQFYLYLLIILIMYIGHYDYKVDLTRKITFVAKKYVYIYILKCNYNCHSELQTINCNESIKSHFWNKLYFIWGLSTNNIFLNIEILSIVYSIKSYWNGGVIANIKNCEVLWVILF